MKFFMFPYVFIFSTIGHQFFSFWVPINSVIVEAITHGRTKCGQYCILQNTLKINTHCNFLS
jgi:hypothetical protein